jgi:hypothetical protein
MNTSADGDRSGRRLRLDPGWTIVEADSDTETSPTQDPDVRPHRARVRLRDAATVDQRLLI